MRSPPSHLRPRRGFSLLELAIVIVIIGIIAASAVPAFSSLSDTRRAAAINEIERLLTRSRARAVSEGRPHAVLVDLNTQTLTSYEITTTGAAPSASQTADGRGLDALVLAATYPGVTVKALQAGDGSSPSSAYIWFGVDGTPQLRKTDGTLVAECSQNTVLTLDDGSSIDVIRYSGAIER